MDVRLAEENLRGSYRDGCAAYRKDDEIEVTTPHHQRLRKVLGEMTASFGRPISVLEAGCGTGRYFHCLRNVERLVGLDISPEMLEAARHPVRESEITTEDIQLIRGNVFTADLEPDSFDLIYSLGMFGFGCPVTPEICARFHEWLKPGGKLFFNVIDRGGWPLPMRIRGTLRNWVYAVAPGGLRERMDQRAHHTPLFDLTHRELESILRRTPFQKYRIKSERCLSPLWNGSHLEVLAEKC
jgi:SAM-dependent methyltransferase